MTAATDRYIDPSGNIQGPFPIEKMRPTNWDGECLWVVLSEILCGVCQLVTGGELC